jgi:radical SAM protein with 4Fe4S-binding SPASM domain
MINSEVHPIVMWEVTRACDLHCRNCSIGATPNRGTNELTTYEVFKTIDQISALSPREFIITGGDPMAREDIGQIINYARRRGLDPALVVSPTRPLTADAITRLERNGLTRLIFSIDGSGPEIHEAVHGTKGTFDITLHGIRWAEKVGLEIEINTLVTRKNTGDLDAIAELIRPVGIKRWNLYFLVPVLASMQSEMISAAEAENLFGTIDAIQRRERFAVRVFEAPHYRRYLLQRSLESRIDNAMVEDWEDFRGYAGADQQPRDMMESAVENGRGFVFISHAGDVRASELLLASAGNLCYHPLSQIYRNSDLLAALRDPANLKGKCGRCEYHHICSGSRARAWATSGDLFGDDPLCAYEPGAAIPLPMATLADAKPCA